MSTVMLRREVQDVCFDAAECGVTFADSAFDVQIAFLDAFALRIRDADYASWPMQCRYIVDDMTPEQKQRVRSALRTLMDHLEELPI